MTEEFEETVKQRALKLYREKGIKLECEWCYVLAEPKCPDYPHICALEKGLKELGEGRDWILKELPHCIEMRKLYIESARKETRIKTLIRWIRVNITRRPRKIGKREVIVECLRDLGKAHHSLRQIEQAVALYEEALAINSEGASGLVSAISGWREYGETTLTGFYSDDYYSSLPYP